MALLVVTMLSGMTCRNRDNATQLAEAKDVISTWQHVKTQCWKTLPGE